LSEASVAGGQGPDSGLEISLAAWSMHRMFEAREVDQVGMVRLCAELGIRGFEFVNTFFPSPQYRYLTALNRLAEELGVDLVLIMCDAEGDLAAVDGNERRQAAKNHHKWVDIAQVLGCHSIRCNIDFARRRDLAEAGPEAAPDEVCKRAAEGLAALLEYADRAGIDVLLENHGGLSSDPDWLVSVVETVGHRRLGTLPDFGNFAPETDRYEAVRKLMPYAKGVSAKCYGFDADGNETRIDFPRMLGIVRDVGYTGFVGIEYEGRGLAEREGIAAAKNLLERLI
jgi:L-ribulose-5-phosphate 3-epimerase